MWAYFKGHHYLNATLNKAAHTYAGFWGDSLVAFGGVLPFPHGHIKHGWRESRIVVLPDFQGLGIGMKFSEAIASVYVDAGGRYFSRTAHPRMGHHRDGSPLWKPTSNNRVLQKAGNGANFRAFDERRLCWSHEYIGIHNDECGIRTALCGT